MVTVIYKTVKRGTTARLYHDRDVHLSGGPIPVDCVPDKRVVWSFSSASPGKVLRGLENGLDSYNKSCYPSGLYLETRTRDKNSSRVALRLRKLPSMVLVTVLDPCFSTPRIIMQKCWASHSTPTPRGEITWAIASATCCVSRSCNCSRRANMSTIRG